MFSKFRIIEVRIAKMSDSESNSELPFKAKKPKLLQHHRKKYNIKYVVVEKSGLT